MVMTDEQINAVGSFNKNKIYKLISFISNNNFTVNFLP